ncbi:glutamate receptor-like isoform X2 [Lineus longissimus]|uniref:glutamate receptor-like isoform X2 n=1 Tax=Lineus longissimus TaxID=88925 RepID=UPI00315C6DB4
MDITHAMFWITLLIGGTVVYGFPTEIPIGAIFDDSLESKEILTAFKYAVEKHKDTAPYKFRPLIKLIKASDSLQLSRAICDIMADGVFLVLGPNRIKSLNVVQSYSMNFKMPYITSGMATNINPHRQRYILHLRPQFTQALVDLIAFYRWTSIHYLYDTKEGLMRIEELLRLIHEHDGGDNHIDIDVRHVPEPFDAYSLLRQMDHMESSEEEKHIILDFATENATQSILRQIRQMGMNRARYHYLIAGLNVKAFDFEGFLYSGVNVTGFQLLDLDDLNLKIFLSDWKNLDQKIWPGAGKETISYEAALTYDAVHVIGGALDDMRNENREVFRYTFRHKQVYNNDSRGIQCSSDPVVPWKHGDGITNAMQRVRYNGLTGNVAFDSKGHRKEYQLDIWSMQQRVGMVKVGNWSKPDGLVVTGIELFENITDVSENKTKRVTSILVEPFLYKKTDSEDGIPLVGNDRFEGYCKDLAQHISEMGKFSYQIQIVKDHKYGLLENGSWTGMIGELTRHEADLVIAPLTITSKRERVVDFSKPFMNLGISIMIKKPDKQKPGVFSFLAPLAPRVWCCVFLAAVVVSLILFFVSRVSPSEWVVEKALFSQSLFNEFGFGNSLWYALGAFMQQGGDNSPRSMSGRVVASVWSLFCLILISSYTANLAAFLTIERMLTPINSVEELAGQNEIKYGTIDSGSTRSFFESSKISVYKGMGQRMMEDPSVFVKSKREGVERVRSSKGKFAFLTESTMNEFTNQRKPCNTMKVGDNLDSKGYGVATPLNSDIRADVNLAVLKLREEETLTTLQKKWWYDKSECVRDKTDSKQSSLSLSNLAGVFYILIGGLGVAMAVSLLEFLYKSKKEAQKKKVTLLQNHAQPSYPIQSGLQDTWRGGRALSTHASFAFAPTSNGNGT